MLQHLSAVVHTGKHLEEKQQGGLNMFLSQLTEEEKLRFDLILQAGFSLNEIPLVIRFIKGDDYALEELQEFREWKEKKMFAESLFPFK